MQRNKKEKLQFRYYEIPREDYVLALLGESWTRDYGKKDQGLHFHNYLEIGYCSAGEGTLIFDREEFPYFPETLFMIPPNCPHNIISNREEKSTWEFLYVDVERFLADMYPGRSRMAEEICRRIYHKPRFLTCERFYELGSLTHQIIQEIREKKEFYRESVKGYLLAFLMEMARTWAGTGPDAWGHEEHTEWKENGSGGVVQIANALHYVGKHYGEPIRVRDMANACGMSEPHFRRIFQEHMHIAPSDYISKVRIRSACEMMMNTAASLDEIAMKTGFISMSTFNRNFKKIMGTSPHCWRKERSNGLTKS